MKELKISYIPIEEITPYERNAREHDDADVSAIAKSIEEFVFSDPIGVWGDDNVIVEGHGRLLAAKKLGMKKVPIIRLDHLNDEQRRAYALAHNKTAELSLWDFETLHDELEGITHIDMSEFGFDLDAFAPATEAKEDDFYMEPPADPKAKQGDIYALGEHRLMCGDSTDVNVIDRLMDGVKADGIKRTC